MTLSPCRMGYDTRSFNYTFTDLHQSLRQRYDYSTKEKSMILSSIGIGTMLATFPITHLIAKVGARSEMF